MTRSRSHLAGTTPFQNRIPVRLLAPQHVKGRLGQMARHCSNGFVVSLALAQTVIELADVPLRTAPVIDGHRVGGLHKCPLQIAVHVRSQPAVPHAAATGVHPRSEEHTSELQSRLHLVCRLLLEKKKKKKKKTY